MSAFLSGVMVGALAGGLVVAWLKASHLADLRACVSSLEADVCELEEDLTLLAIKEAQARRDR